MAGVRRHLVLPTHGAALVSTDLHGNLDDFRALEQTFAALGPDAHWVILGDLVHAPDPASRRDEPALYDYDDGSMAIVDGVIAAQRAAPGRVHLVLGNHDHGHVGGPHPRKFYGDEVEALESTLSPAERDRLRGLFGAALLAVVAPCGALLTHGSPDASLVDLAELDLPSLALGALDGRQRGILRALLTSYGQTDEVCREMLAAVSRRGGWDLRVVIHGHDRDEAGFFVEGETQLCPVIFGAPRAAKRCVLLDLAARYDSAASLRDGAEIRRLHPT